MRSSVLADILVPDVRTLRDEVAHQLDAHLRVQVDHLTPRDRRWSSPPMNVRCSPITTHGMPQTRIAPVHMPQGDSVVYIVERR